MGAADRYRYRLHAVRAADVSADLGYCPRRKTATLYRASAAAGLYLRAGDGAHLYRAGTGGRRRRFAVSGGVAASVRTDWPVCGLYPAGAVDVWSVHAAAALIAANPSDADEQQTPGRFTRRRLCDGSHCRTDLFALHHRAAERHPAVYCPERQPVARRRHAVFVCAGHGAAADPGHRIWQPSVAEERPVDEPCEDRIRFCDPGASGLFAGAYRRRTLGPAPVVAAGRGLL